MIVSKELINIKGKSGMKQYIQPKPIKWGFKFWFCCSSKSVFLYQMTSTSEGNKHQSSIRFWGRSSSPADK